MQILGSNGGGIWFSANELQTVDLFHCTLPYSRFLFGLWSVLSPSETHNGLVIKLNEDTRTQILHSQWAEQFTLFLFFN